MPAQIQCAFIGCVSAADVVAFTEFGMVPACSGCVVDTGYLTRSPE